MQNWCRLYTTETRNHKLQAHCEQYAASRLAPPRSGVTRHNQINRDLYNINPPENS